MTFEKYLEQRLKSRAFKRWSIDEQTNVRLKLGSQADGMFRLVSLQLLELGKSMSRARRREGLDVMPHSLHEFYHRMLDYIPQENVDTVREALNWLVFAARPLTLAELAEAVIIKSSHPCFDPEERFDDERCLLEILPSGFTRYSGTQLCLQSSSEDEGDTQDGRILDPEASSSRRRCIPTIQLAHLSVKDYLLSTRVSNQVFKLDQLSACCLLRDACMDYALYIAQASSTATPMKNLFRQFPLLKYVCGCASCHFNESHDRVLLYYLAINFFWNPERNCLSSTCRLKPLEFVPAKAMTTSCSSGRRCEQCLRIFGVRSAILPSKYQDSLEAFNCLVIPDYLNGHFTKANVESFVLHNVVNWGTQPMLVRMNWGFWQPLEVIVVTVGLPHGSELSYQHQAVSNETNLRSLIKKESPPLAILDYDLALLEPALKDYVEDIARMDLSNYVPIVYDDQDSDLPERLLSVVGRRFEAGFCNNDESALLRDAVEMHIIETMMERALILDEKSMLNVEAYLNTMYPNRYASRLAQRQIKFLLFEMQHLRVLRVLKGWKALLLRKRTKGDAWEACFCVFLILTLVLDKIIGMAYYFCEGRIAHNGHEPVEERRKFSDLVTLIERELFEAWKEAFHNRYGTREAGRQSFNPIRDGLSSWNGKPQSPDLKTKQLVLELQNIIGVFDNEIKTHTVDSDDDAVPFTNEARLASIFLNDFSTFNS